ncbi:MAG: peptidoglycan DD-metalloendopeptidase family protein [Clostridiales bacterium]|jgi:murein DD-endopeptidase MepM/ murein hydrolase activator NlpD|nr:peptidoglycan DD-metalloendopeptidase family protein [Clostridiales bacterium]
MKITVSKDKILDLKDKVLTKIIDFRIEKLSRLGNKALAGIGIGILGVVIVCSAVVFSGVDDTAEEPLPSAMVAGAAEEETIQCYSIHINGNRIVTLANEEDAKAVLDNIVAHYQTEGSEVIDVSYDETVEIIETEEINPDIMTVSDAVSLIITGTKEPKTYVVEEGDCLWDIAIINGMNVDDLIAANPQADPDHLKIGTVLNLFELKPYVHLKLVEQIDTTEKIEYGIKYEDTDTLYKGEAKVKIAGEYGQRQVKKEIVKENGIIISTQELETKVISEPKDQVMVRGTKPLSTLVGTGSFVKPMSHLEISSSFGASRGGRRHTGVDLRNPKGTPIKVVDDGVVTFVGYRGTYGNMVIVSHGNGIETRYAHCDTMSVSIGDVVKKGDQIATVGNTGRATGYHLHFEVRKNGVPQNPMNYL